MNSYFYFRMHHLCPAEGIDSEYAQQRAEQTEPTRAHGYHLSDEKERTADAGRTRFFTGIPGRKADPAL